MGMNVLSGTSSLEICSFIARDTQRYAGLFAHRILYTIENAAEFPEGDRVLPEYNNPST